jgi:threonine/homoserine/homoserine lactone efflux protein
MNVGFLVIGIIIGFSIAATIGPIGILCIKRTISEGRMMGFVSGLGAATADLLYACVIGFGLTIISGFLLDHMTWLRIIGGGILVCIGLQTLFTQPSEKLTSENGKGLIRAYYSTFFLTVMNPMTIIMFAGIMAGLGGGITGNNYLSTSLLVIGIFVGSVLWWAILSLGFGSVREKIHSNILLWINRISGFIIIGFGIAVLGNWI